MKGVFSLALGAIVCNVASLQNSKRLSGLNLSIGSVKAAVLFYTHLSLVVTIESNQSQYTRINELYVAAMQGVSLLHLLLNDYDQRGHL
eukprot:scaffold22917_cov83-Skeletonema_marinoi.AAC.2